MSSSRLIYGPDDQVLQESELMVVGRLALQKRIWGWGWGMASLSGSVDVSSAINAQIARAGGEGVVNLMISAENCGINHVPIITILPFYPGCTLVTISGDIIKMKKSPIPPAIEVPAEPSSKNQSKMEFIP